VEAFSDTACICSSLPQQQQQQRILCDHT
jgi:hypothetical protein